MCKSFLVEVKVMTDGTKKPIVVGLHENVSAFFDQFYKKYSAEMKCGLGCSQCCVQGVSVFPVEAQLIQEWVLSLSELEKNHSLTLGRKIQLSQLSKQKNANFFRMILAQFMRLDQQFVVVKVCHSE